MFLRSHPRQGVQAAFQEGAVAVFPAEVRDGSQVVFEDEGRKGFRREGRIAARQVGHADDFDAVRGRGRFPHEGFRVHHVVVSAQDQLGSGDELSPLQGRL